MSNVKGLSLSQGIITPGPTDAESMKFENGEYKPWDSVQEYLSYKDADMSAIKPYQTIIVKQSVGVAKEMQNSENLRTFTLKNQNSGGGSSPSVSSSDSIYVIEPSDWSITEGDMVQDSNKHYSSMQYDIMHNNGDGFSQAIKYAAQNGYKHIKFKPGTYCFCASMPSGRDSHFPQIYTTDLNDVTIDLCGSTLKLCVDDTQYGKYYEYRGGKVWQQHGVLFLPCYCHNLTICNGTMVGDRFTRSYTTFAAGDNSSENESTYGIQVGMGNENLKICDIEFREFMGDGIVGNPGLYRIENKPSEVTGGNMTIQFNRIGNAFRSPNINDNGTESTNDLNYALSDYVDTTNLYASDYGISNRAKDKELRKFELRFTLGYTRMSEFYGNKVFVLTYTADKTFVRKFYTSYLQQFTLTPSEKYIRVLFCNEDCVFDAYKESKTYSNGDYICSTKDNVVVEFECISSTNVVPGTDSSKWTKSRVVGVGVAATWEEGKTYSKGARVTYNVGTAGVCEQCTGTTSGTYDSSKWKFIETPRTCTTFVNYNVGIMEHSSTECKIMRCRFLDSHRGNVANLPDNTVVEDCVFYKHQHAKGDGWKAPNVGDNWDCTGHAWLNNYHLDQEDWFSSGLKFIRCKFGTSGSLCARMLVGCMNFEMSECTGFLYVNLYKSSFVNIHDNNFNKFEITAEVNTACDWDGGGRYISRDILIHHNKLICDYWILYKTAGQRLNISDNYIIISNTRTGGGMGDFENTGYDIFARNIVSSICSTRKINDGVAMVVCAADTTGTQVNTDRSINVYAPTNGIQVNKSFDLVLCESNKTDRHYRNARFSALDLCVLVCNNDVNGAESKTVRFTGCDFITVGTYYNPLQIRTTVTKTAAKVFNIYFKDCLFDTNTAIDVINLQGNNPGISGETYNLYFDNCIFNTPRTGTLANNSAFVLKRFKDCTTSRTLKFNGSEITV